MWSIGTFPMSCSRASIATVLVIVGCHSQPAVPLQDSGAPEVEIADAGSPVDLYDASPDADASTVGLDSKFAVFCVAARDALVERESRCDGWSPSIARAWINNDPCKWWGAGIKGQRMVFTGQNANDCLNELKSLSCDADSVPGICGQALAGLLKAGASCNMPAQQILSECEPGSICVVDVNGHGCLGTCQHRPQLGEACGKDGLCAAGSTCNQVTNRCSARAHAGDLCGRDGPFDCDPGYWCPSAEENTGPCRPQTPEGMSPCYGDNECVAGTKCIYIKNALPGVCKKPSQPGDSCRGDDPDACSPGFLGCDTVADSTAPGRCALPYAYQRPCGAQLPMGALCFTAECDQKSPGACRYIGESVHCVSPAECGPDTTCLKRNNTVSSVCSPICTPQASP